MSEWQPIQTAPKGDDPAERNGPSILVAAKAWDGSITWVGEAFWHASDQAWYWANLDSEYGAPVNATHWMPLPAPPQDIAQGPSQ